MKALSLRQPWAALVVSGMKPIENRRWSTSFRGTFLIHAAKGMTRLEYDDVMLWLDDVFDEEAPALPALKDVVRGGIIGIATLDGVLRPGTIDHAPLLANSLGVDLRWHMQDQFGFVLRNIRRTRFVSCRGALGFFEVPSPFVADALGYVP